MKRGCPLRVVMQSPRLWKVAGSTAHQPVECRGWREGRDFHNHRGPRTSMSQSGSGSGGLWSWIIQVSARRGLFGRGGPLSSSAPTRRRTLNHPSGTLQDYVKLAADQRLTIPLPAVLRTTIAAATFHNLGLCITALSGKSAAHRERPQCG